MDSGRSNNFLVEVRDADPNAYLGRIYLNTTDKKFYYFDGDEWVSLSSRLPYVVVASSTSEYKKSADLVCDGTDDQEEIQQAINSLPDEGGTVLLLDGTFNISESIAIDKSNVIVTGIGSQTVLDGENISSSTDAIISIGSNSHTEDLLITSLNLYKHDTLLTTSDGSKIHINNCTLSNPSHSASISLGDLSYLTNNTTDSSSFSYQIDDNSVVSNNIFGSVVTGTHGTYNIVKYNNFRDTSDENTVNLDDGSVFSGNVGYVAVHVSSYSYVSDNSIDHIYINDGATDISVYHNRLGYHSGDGAIECDGTADHLTIDGNSGWAFILSGTYLTIINNRIISGADVLRITGGDYITIANNVIHTGNGMVGWGAILVKDCSHVTIVGNTIDNKGADNSSDININADSSDVYDISVTGNNISNAKYGVNIYTASGKQHQGITITGNVFESLDTGVYSPGAGSKYIIVKNNIFRNVTTDTDIHADEAIVSDNYDI